MSKEIGRRWTALPDDERQTWEQKAIEVNELRLRCAQEAAHEEADTLPGHAEEEEKSERVTQLPLSVLRKMVLLDEDITRVSPAALHALGVSVECFIQVRMMSIELLEGTGFILSRSHATPGSNQPTTQGRGWGGAIISSFLFISCPFLASFLGPQLMVERAVPVARKRKRVQLGIRDLGAVAEEDQNGVPGGPLWFLAEHFPDMIRRAEAGKAAPGTPGAAGAALVAGGSKPRKGQARGSETPTKAERVAMMFGPRR